MHDTIKNNWNSVVTNADHIYILGDMVWGEGEEIIQYVSTLRGNKHLLLGNHDRIKDQRYRQLFVEITNYKKIKDSIKGKEYYIVMSHYPILFYQGQHRGAIHLYGHVHNTREEKLFQDACNRIKETTDIPMNCYNVGCMLWNYTPVTLKQILEESVL